MDKKPTNRSYLLAVWHWPRWVWITALLLMPIVYVLSAPIIWFSVRRFNPTGVFVGAVEDLYSPVESLEDFPVIGDIIEWEFTSMEKVLGKVRPSAVIGWYSLSPRLERKRQPTTPVTSP